MGSGALIGAIGGGEKEKVAVKIRSPDQSKKRMGLVSMRIVARDVLERGRSPHRITPTRRLPLNHSEILQEKKRDHLLHLRRLPPRQFKL